MARSHHDGQLTLLRQRRRVAGWVAVVALAVLAAAAGLALSWRGELPDPVATHWSFDGTADGFSSLNGALSLMLGFGMALVVGFAAVTMLAGRWATTRRVGAAATIWSAVFVSLVMLGTLHIQRGLVDAEDAGGVGGVLAVAIVGSLLPAVVVGALIPGDARLPTTDPVAADAPRVSVRIGQRPAWIGHAGAGPGIGVAVVATMALVALVTVTRMWALLIVVGVVGFLTASMLRWVVRIDVTGLTIRSALGWPRIRVPLDEVVRADVIQLRPVRYFGGWGLRVGRGGRHRRRHAQHPGRPVTDRPEPHPVKAPPHVVIVASAANRNRTAAGHTEPAERVARVSLTPATSRRSILSGRGVRGTRQAVGP